MNAGPNGVNWQALHREGRAGSPLSKYQLISSLRLVHCAQMVRSDEAAAAAAAAVHAVQCHGQEQQPQYYLSVMVQVELAFLKS